MQIVRDDPGLVLELAEEEPRASATALLVALGLTALVATPWRGLFAMLVHGAGRDALDLAGSAFWAALGLVLMARAFGGRRLETLRADRDAAGIEWRESRLLGLLRTHGAVPRARLASFVLELARPGARGPLPLRLTLRTEAGADGPARERKLELRVKGVDRTEDVASLAMWLGAAAGLSFQRVVLNDSGRFAIELASKDAAPGMEPVPARTAPAEAASEAARRAAGTPRLPPFDPAAFRGDARVTCWEPGREVRIERGPGLALLLSPLLLAAPLGPAAFLLPGLRGVPLLPRLVATGLLTLVGLGLALAGWAALQLGLPRRAVLDWTRRRLRLDAPFRRRELSFDELLALELRPIVHRTGRARGGMERTSYWQQVRVRLRGAPDAEGELLVETKPFRNDASSPRLMALPLARELSEALELELHETAAA